MSGPTSGAGTGQIRTDVPVAVTGATAEGTSIAVARADHQHGAVAAGPPLTSLTANPAATGVVRLAKTDAVSFRNNANSADLPIGINASDALTFNGSPIGAGGGAPFISNTANPAATGIVRLAKTDAVSFRNNANTADLPVAISAADALTFGGVPVALAPGYAALLATTAAGQSIPSAAVTIVVFGTVELDTDTAYNAATGRYTVPTGKGGRYGISAGLNFAASVTGTAQLSIYKTAALVRQQQMTNPTGTSLTISSPLNLAAGDVIDIRINQQSGSAQALSAVAAQNFFCIEWFPS
jgi:hypothetical protein